MRVGWWRPYRRRTQDLLMWQVAGGRQAPQPPRCQAFERTSTAGDCREALKANARPAAPTSAARRPGPGTAGSASFCAAWVKWRRPGAAMGTPGAWPDCTIRVVVDSSCAARAVGVSSGSTAAAARRKLSANCASKRVRHRHVNCRTPGLGQPARQRDRGLADKHATRRRVVGLERCTRTPCLPRTLPCRPPCPPYARACAKDRARATRYPPQASRRRPDLRSNRALEAARFHLFDDLRAGHASRQRTHIREHRPSLGAGAGYGKALV
jgi:hypothetical protein